MRTGRRGSFFSVRWLALVAWLWTALGTACDFGQRQREPLEKMNSATHPAPD